MNILVISNNYPSYSQPNYGAFVYNLMQEMQKNNEITIITPLKIHQIFDKKQKTYGIEKCKVYRPLYFSFSNRNILGFNTGKLSAYFYKKAVRRVLRKLDRKPEVIYAHFLSNALSIFQYSKEFKIPLVVASGESSYGAWMGLESTVKSEMQNTIDHVICVSKENQEQLIALGFDSKKLTVVPNAVNYEMFMPLDKVDCKEKLGMSSKAFTVGFIGHFIHRKGPNRVIKAIESLNDKDIQLICVGGKGKLTENSFTKEIAPVPNYQLPEIYNAFDVFVLPTLNEGHCNVIEEAKACAIPIISSKGTSVEEQIDSTVGILVDPLNIDEIANAISKVKEDDALREMMTENLLSRRGENSLQNRANKISGILKNVINRG